MLDYMVLGGIFVVFIVLFYFIIVVHDIPYEISKSRNHPHQDAIHVAGWISLFTLHAIWPFLWIWATLYREDRGWGFSSAPNEGGDSGPVAARFAALEERLSTLESRSTEAYLESEPLPQVDAPAESSDNTVAASDEPTDKEAK